MPRRRCHQPDPTISDGGCGSGAGDTLLGLLQTMCLGLSLSQKPHFGRLDKNETRYLIR